jgi:hypothetical protein
MKLALWRFEVGLFRERRHADVRALVGGDRLDQEERCGNFGK